MHMLCNIKCNPAVETRSASEGAEAIAEYGDWCPVTGVLRDLWMNWLFLILLQYTS
jgi:hypothetical protein